MLVSDNSLTVAIQGKDLSMVRGNSDSLTIGLKKNGERLKLAEGDKIFFSVKKHPQDSDFVLQKEVVEFGVSGIATIFFFPEDTRDIPAGDYVYDIRLDLASGTVTTLLEKSNFVLREAIMYD